MKKNSSGKVLFVTNFCPHYRVETFELLSAKLNIDFIFFSEGKEKYWQPEHGVKQGKFRHIYLSGFSIGHTRITPVLPFILLFKKYDSVIKCINGKFALPVSFLIAKARGKPFILWTGIWTRINTPYHKFIFPLTSFIYKHSTAIVVYGIHVKNYLISEGVQPGKIFIAHHAVKNSDYNVDIAEEVKRRLRGNLKIGENKKIVLYLGRIEIEKGLDLLIDSFYDLKRDDAILIIAGTGSELEILKQKVLDYNINEKVVFTGYIRNTDAVKYYAVSYIYVLPSITTKTIKETWGLVINEAFNQKCPVIVSESVGAAAGRFVEHGINGFVVPEKNRSALKEALARLLNNEELRNQMGNNAFEKVSKWDNNYMIQGFIEAIDFVGSL